MGLTIRGVGAAATPPIEGLNGLRMTSVPLANAPLPAGRAPRGVSVGISNEAARVSQSSTPRNMCLPGALARSP